jgi:putative polyhydroxyalkanoate system protein
VSDIKFVRKHHVTLQKAKEGAQKIADDLAQEYDLTSEWEGDTLHFRRSGVEGEMRVTDTTIELQVSLGFLLRPFKATLEEHIERHLDERLGDDKPAATRGTRKA